MIPSNMVMKKLEVLSTLSLTEARVKCKIKTKMQKRVNRGSRRSEPVLEVEAVKRCKSMQGKQCYHTQGTNVE